LRHIQNKIVTYDLVSKVFIVGLFRTKYRLLAVSLWAIYVMNSFEIKIRRLGKKVNVII